MERQSRAPVQVVKQDLKIDALKLAEDRRGYVDLEIVLPLPDECEIVPELAVGNMDMDGLHRTSALCGTSP
jgi:hypothetical protein